MLVDTGPDECWPALKTRLAAIPTDSKGRRKLDLVVISHIDHDHIGAASDLFADKTLNLVFEDVWFNAPKMPADRGVAEGNALAALLGAAAGKLPWNRAWAGRHAVTGADAGFLQVAGKRGKPTITLLSPSPTALGAQFKVWDQAVAEVGKAEADAIPPSAREVWRPNLEALASRVTPTDRAAANGSSIALLLEHKGVSILLGADAHPTVLAPALRSLAASRLLPAPLEVDVFKLCHHGSRANTTLDLLSAVKAKHYVVSTNGAIFGHPDDEAIARVILHGGQEPRLWFNYRTAKTSKWSTPELQQASAYETTLPQPGSTGIRIDLT